MFGAMPSDFMLFEVSEQPDVEEDEEHSVTTSDANNDSKWDVNHRCVDQTAGVHEPIHTIALPAPRLPSDKPRLSALTTEKG